MGRRCTVCGDENRYAIDTALVKGIAYDRVASQYCPKGKKVKTFARAILRHHKNGHTAELVIDAQEKEERRVGLNLSAILEDTVRDLRDLADDARANNDFRAAASALGQVLRAVEIVGLDKTPNLPESDGFMEIMKSKAPEVWKGVEVEIETPQVEPQLKS